MAILLTGLNLNAQYFNKAFDTRTGSETGLQLLMLDTSYLIAWGGTDTSLSGRYGYLILSENGNVLHEKDYIVPNKAVRATSTIKTRDKRIVDWRTVQYYDSSAVLTSDLLLIISNLEGDTMFTKKFTETNIKNVYASTLIETPDSGFMLVYRRNLAPDFDPMVIRTDKLGNELWRKPILDRGQNDNVHSIVQHPNGDYYVGGGVPVVGGNNAYVIRMDSVANVKFFQRYNSSYTHMADLAVLKDSNLIFGTDTLIYEAGNTFFTKKQLIKIDPDGNVLWRKIHDKTIDLTGYHKVIEDSNGFLFATATYLGEFSGGGYTLTKMTSAGDTIWMNYYYHEQKGSYDDIFDFTQAFDGGFVFTGTTIPDNSNQDVWVLKVDSNGCQDADCTSRVYDIRLGVNYLPELQTEFKVYPNPVVSELNVVQQTGGETTWQYQLLNLNGQVLQSGGMASSKTLNVSELSSGNYVLQLQHGPIKKSYKVVK